MRPCGVVRPHESVMRVSCLLTCAISNPVHGRTRYRAWAYLGAHSGVCGGAGRHTWAYLGALWASTCVSGHSGTQSWAHTISACTRVGTQSATRWHSGATTHELWAHSSRMSTHLGATGGHGRESVCEWQFS